MSEPNSASCQKNTAKVDISQHEIKPKPCSIEPKSHIRRPPETKPPSSAGCCPCPTTRRKGDGGFMNLLVKALGCCGLCSAIYDPRTSN